MNRNFQGVALVLMMAFSGTAFADQWIPYTDGRTGGCWLNKNNQLYGCTPQQSQSSTRDQTASDGRDYCDVERQRLTNAKNDRNRTVTSVRRAEDRFAKTGCSE